MLSVMSVQSELPNSGEMLQRPAILLQDAGTTDMVLTELAGNHMARDGGLVEGSLHMKNALQSQEDAQPQQKLNKRRYSVNVGFKHPGLSKRRRRANSESDPVLPSNFLLGGNIFDPLNLNSLLDEKVNKALNAQTPKSSPLPVKNRDPVEILIPKDITDPLNLGGDAGAGVLLSPVKSRRRHRNRHHGAVLVGLTGQLDPSHGEKSKVSEGAVSGSLFSPAVSVLGTAADVSAESAVKAVKESPRPYELNTSINCRDEVVQPILPRRRSHPSSSSSAPQTQALQPSKHRKRRRTSSRSDRLSITPTLSTKQTIAEKAHSQAFHTPVVGGGTIPSVTRRIQQNPRRPRGNFQHGTCSRYYGYRTPELNADPRLAVFKPEWFHNKKVLDVGCNTGHITLAIARHWSPARIMGVDIEEELVHAARLNLRHFLSELCGQQESHRTLTDVSAETGEGSEVTGEGLPPLMKLQLEQVQAFRRFPLAFTRCRGPIAPPPIMPHIPGLFPSNVFFMKGNYVPDSDVAVMSQREEYDVILCLSLTKWVHLNFGDAGIQRLFHRIYRHLLPGGLLILEPQPWSSYSRRKRLTKSTHRNYSSIRLKPDHFSSYLTSDVGFSCYELLETSQNSHKGSQRPVYVFHKGSSSNRK
ncbi:7SK snRNA methylphosphate capping enzyme [Triplophysa tibetana]|uniref:RNA methyltransferase n=1 Tax=Triplophysa tibetana TaxID=1572043 RepID=A0A5A9NC98_9TELE|nr:7SK snRNA methylphosphate capping enzyme [Triplophysa tibetana]